MLHIFFFKFKLSFWHATSSCVCVCVVLHRKIHSRCIISSRVSGHPFPSPAVPHQRNSDVFIKHGPPWHTAIQIMRFQPCPTIFAAVFTTLYFLGGSHEFHSHPPNPTHLLSVQRVFDRSFGKWRARHVSTVGEKPVQSMLLVFDCPAPYLCNESKMLNRLLGTGMSLLSCPRSFGCGQGCCRQGLRNGKEWVRRTGD